LPGCPPGFLLDTNESAAGGPFGTIRGIVMRRSGESEEDVANAGPQKGGDDRVREFSSW
jgi:hypothetical protein